MNEDPRLRRSSSQQEISFEASPESKASYMNSAQTQEEHDVRAARKRKHSLSLFTDTAQVWPRAFGEQKLPLILYRGLACLAWNQELACHTHQRNTSVLGKSASSRLFTAQDEPITALVATRRWWTSSFFRKFEKTLYSGRFTIPHQWKGIVKGTARRRLMAFNGPICGYGPTLQSDQARSLRGDAVSLVNAV
ncbi:hypothetical protein FPSE_07421 [Fusarium pseudograminearum CS3096]|uniref:Uncharacterized protein n=1 Tax=Fusarium pseudograminearum (strain CS3096) TaxID=1028729 RepID=K3VE44_FUSPC|nr:hypothetical protein FPSE_07421 [Fusarium pseudograminearum CS3096]EKJ72397.1 hypothetical protein FPSE_07421 [Fusarium pseudograminearum CS3096]